MQQRGAERALDALSFSVSDARYGLGAYLGIYLLAEHGWDPASIGAALSIGMLTGLASQAPLGALVDAVQAKRALIAGAVVVMTATCLVIPLAPQFWSVALAGLVGALAGVTIGPTLAAISLGVVGPARFARRAGRNEALFHLGDGAISLAILLTAPFFGNSVVFWFMGFTAVASIAAAAAVPAGAIDHAVARGLLPGEVTNAAQPTAWRVLLGSRPLLIFAACGALFHLANASMLGLVSQKLALGNLGQGIALTAASAIVAQAVMVPVAALVAARVDAWGRKPLLLAAFIALVLRGTLFTLSDERAWLIGVQLLDGVGAGLIGALFPIVVADLTRGSGHFAAAQGVVGTLHGIGSMMSMVLGGGLVVWAGYDTAFLVLASIAALGGILVWSAMPETRGAPAMDRTEAKSIA
ncbi:MFS transporter [Belnapia rosea]|uniref:Predicted arabinose efflux permease, MFS family n=1 Tax=Belnapia rosea TaxID=938405 RepID=A0A1G7DMI8_9PROT|nr:MFS transporter [Belnapia rosea]SDE52698.1 Predicted arabinose efflux permease, MFS family [Belnapia rosea]